jgi:hypothetical protein
MITTTAERIPNAINEEEYSCPDNDCDIENMITRGATKAPKP